MIIVRRNNELKTPIFEQAFHVFLKLPDGSEHEIPGVHAIKRDKKISYELYQQYTVEFVVNDQAVRFE